jgi:hypothetical protein
VANLQQLKNFNRPYLIGLCTCTIRFKHLSVLSSGIGVRRDICKPQICEVVSGGDGLVLFSRNKEERAALRWQERRRRAMSGSLRLQLRRNPFVASRAAKEAKAASFIQA